MWLALLIAPFLKGGLSEIVTGLMNALSNPFDIQLCEDSLKTVLIFLAAYGMAISIYFSTRKIIVGERNTAPQNGEMQKPLTENTDSTRRLITS